MRPASVTAVKWRILSRTWIRSLVEWKSTRTSSFIFCLSWNLGWTSLRFATQDRTSRYSNVLNYVFHYYQLCRPLLFHSCHKQLNTSFSTHLSFWGEFANSHNISIWLIILIMTIMRIIIINIVMISIIIIIIFHVHVAFYVATGKHFYSTC